MDKFDELQKVMLEIDTCWRWMITLDEPGVICVEHFPDGYIGDLESGCGDWEITGTLEQVVERLKEIKKGREL